MADEKLTVYKTWDDGFILRKMTLTDAKIVQGWFAKMSPTGRDLEAALAANLEAEGFYIGEMDQDLVACFVSNKMCGNIYDITYLYIKENYQKKGFAKRILFYLSEKHEEDMVIGDTYLKNAGLYSKVTSTHEVGRITRFVGRVNPDWKTGIPVETREIFVSDLDEIMRYDNKCYPVEDDPQRRSLLKEWLNIEGSFSCAAVNDADDIIGYACQRPTFDEGFFIIGPLYAESFQVAYSLVLMICEHIKGKTIYIERNDSNEEAAKLMEVLGMIPHCEFVTLARKLDAEKYNFRGGRVYGITSLDICGL